MCIVCNRELLDKNKCSNENCQDYVNQKENLNKPSPYYITHNYYDSFRLIITKYWHKILKYRSELKRETLITYICNAEENKNSTEIALNSVSLILFVDQANFSKSTLDNNLYFILGQIMDLPLTIRNSKFNILHFFTWGGYIYNFSKALTFIQPSFNTFLQAEIDIMDLNIKLRVNLFVVICDASMTPKAFNINQYNRLF